MKKIFLSICVVFLFASLVSAEWVRGYYRKDGTYVQSYQRSKRNNTKTDNYGPSTNSYDRINPYMRDSDKDGIPNTLDMDDNNDGLNDDYSNPYSNSSKGWFK